MRTRDHRWSFIGLNVGALAVAASVVPPAHGQEGIGLPCRYEVDFVFGQSCGFPGPPNNLANVAIFGISAAGDLCGDVGCAGGNSKACVAPGAGALSMLPIPGQVVQSRATDINGQYVVGHYEDTVTRSGFIFSRGVFTNIPTLPGGTSVEIDAVNSSGVAVGSWGNVIGGPFSFPRPCRWINGRLEDLYPFLLPGSARAWDVNDQGAITGFMGQTSAPPNGHAFIWENGQVTDLGLMPGSFGTEGRSINNHRQVCGIAWFASANQAGFVRRGFFWDNGVFTDLGTLPGTTDMLAWSLSDDGLVVGMAGRAPGTTDKRFVWKAGVLRELLNQSLDGPPNTLVYVVRDNNFLGQVAGHGGAWIGPGQGWHDVGIRLRPVPRNPGDTNCDAVVNVTDLLNVIGHWRQSGVEADVNADWIVDYDDLLQVIEHWST